MSKFKAGFCSGYFDPLHYGHIQYFEAAKDKCDMLTVIVNNDYQAMIKNKKIMMDQQHRANIVKSLRAVDHYVISVDKGPGINQTLKRLVDNFYDTIPFAEQTNYQFFFFNSGDRDPDNYNAEEEEVCRKLNIKQVFLDLPKIHNSSDYRH